jgi:SseB protein N-terminal domain
VPTEPDTGAADPAAASALAAFARGEGSEHAALTALDRARLLVPVVAMLTEAGPASGGKAGEKESEMALPTLVGNDGRRALLAFTGLDALARWRKDARPIPAEASRVWQAAVADDCAVVIDVAGPVPLAVTGARLAALASGDPVPPAHEDPDVRAEVTAAVAAEPSVAGFTLAAGHHGTDLAVTIELEPGGTDAAAVRRTADAIAARLAGRLRRGIEFATAARG